MNSLFDNFYKGKKVLITGHTGFKGSWLSIWLNELGAKVIGYALDPYTTRDNFVLTDLAGKITDIRGDIRDYEKLYKVFKEFNPEIVFHMAAQPLVRLSYQSPKDTYDINIGGTVNILEVIRHSASVKAAVIITSDKCYENKEWLWGYRENDPVGGYDPYSSSKGATEIVISAYRNSFFNPREFSNHCKTISSVRAGNVIGGGDWSKDRIIPDCIRALEQSKAIEIRNPMATRPWQHVLEPLKGYLILASKMYQDPLIFSDAWNFGPDSSCILPVRDVVNEVIKNWGLGEWLDTSDSSNFHETILLNLDCSKARFKLGWIPVLNIKEAIKLTIEWYKTAFACNYENDMYSFCVEQIRRCIP